MAEDNDPTETREWLDALDEVVRNSGAERAGFLIRELGRHALEQGVSIARQRCVHGHGQVHDAWWEEGVGTNNSNARRPPTLVVWAGR